MKNFHFSGNSTPMKKSIILISALSMLGLMLVSCSSSTPETTTTTTRQATVTAPPPEPPPHRTTTTQTQADIHQLYH